MNMKSMISGVLVMSLLSSAYPVTRANAQAPSNDETANILLEMKVMKEMSASILDLQQKIATRQALSAQIAALSGQENQVMDKLGNLSSHPTADIVDQHDQLMNQLRQVDDALKAIRNQLAEFPSLEAMQSNLSRDQKEYATRKAWLSAADKKEIAKHEIELRISRIDQKQNELKMLQAKLDAKDTQGFWLGVASCLTVLSTLSNGDRAVDWLEKTKWSGDAKAGVFLAGAVSIVVAGVSAGFVVHGFFVKNVKRQIDETNAKLEASKKNLELLVEAMNVSN